MSSPDPRAPDRSDSDYVPEASSKKKAIAKKMHDLIHKAEVKGKVKKYKRTLDKFNKTAKDKAEAKEWEYARENRLSDKRMF